MKNKKIVYYHGCFVNYFDHKTGDSTFAVLEQNGFEVQMPELVCCGYPLLNSGGIGKVRKNAKKLTDTLAGFVSQGHEIVYTCPTCGHSLKEVFPELLQNEAAAQVAARASLISEFLLGLRKAGELNLEFAEKKQNIVYHVPCHLRALSNPSVSADLLSILPGAEVYCHNRGCCGMGGTWALKSKKQSDLSGKIGGPVFEEIKERKPQLLSTDCAGCQIQIARHTGLSERELAHPVQIIAEAYRNYIKPHLPKTGFIRS